MAYALRLSPVSTADATRQNIRDTISLIMKASKLDQVFNDTNRDNLPQNVPYRWFLLCQQQILSGAEGI